MKKIILCLAFAMTSIAVLAQTADAGQEQTLCSSETQLQGNDVSESGLTGVWTLVYGDAQIADPTLFNTQVYNLQLGESGFRWTLSNGSNDMVAITNGLPYVNAGPNQTVCAASRNMSANTPEADESGSWSQVQGPPAQIESPTKYNTNISNLQNGLSVFRWTISNKNCSLHDDVEITRHVAYANAGDDVYSCNGTAELSAVEPENGSGYWTVINSGTVTDISAHQTTAHSIADGDNTFRWTVVYEGCSAFDEMTVHNTLVTASTESDKVVCQDESTVSGNNPGTEAAGYWTLTQGTGTIEKPTAFTSQVSGLSLGLNSFKWTVTKNNCESSATFSITNDKLIDINPGNEQIICAYKGFLNAEPPASGIIGTWEVKAGSGILADAALYNTEITNLSKGENRIYWTLDNGNCTITDYVNIFNMLPTDAAVSPGETICESTFLITGNSPAEGEQGIWTALPGAQGTIINPSYHATDVENLGQGENAFRWTISNEYCNSSVELTIVNKKLTTATSEDEILCEAETEISAQNSGSYTYGYWSVVNSGGNPIFDDSLSPNTVVRNLAAGSNTLKWHISNDACEAHDILTLTNSMAVNVSAGDDKISCTQEDWLTAKNPSPAKGVWTLRSGQGTIANPTHYTSNVAGLAVGDNVFRWTVSNNQCSEFDEVNITRINLVADAGTSEEICTNSYNGLSANAPQDSQYGLWSVTGGSGVFENVSSYNTGVTGLAAGENVFTWTLYEAHCSNDDDVIITNNKPSTASVGNDKEICSYTTSISGNSPIIGTGIWTTVSGTGIIQNPENNITEITEINTGESKYKWTVTKGICSSEAIITITNNKVYASTVDDEIICEPATTIQGSEPQNGESGLWTVQSGEGNILNPENHITEVTNIAKGTNKYKWTITKGECSSSDLITITNSTVEVSAWVSGSSSICTDNVSILGNSPDSESFGIWSVVSGGGYIENIHKPSTYLLDIPLGTVKLHWTISNNNCSDFAEISVTNNSITANAGEDQIVCSNFGELSGNQPDNFISGLWTKRSGSGEIAEPTKPGTSVQGLAQGTNSFRWDIEANGCSDYDDVIISRNDFLISAGIDQTICGSHTSLKGESPDPGTGIWTISGSPGVIIEDPTSPTSAVSNISNNSKNTFVWTVSKNGCSAEDEVIVTNSYIQAYAGSNQSVCQDYTVLSAQTPEAGSGLWTLQSGGGYIETPAEPYSTVTGLAAGSNILRWSVTNNTCTSYDEVMISNDAVSASAGADQAVCFPHTTLSADIPKPGGYGLWEVMEGNAVIESPEQYNSKVSELQRGENIFRWTSYLGECYSDGDEITVINKSFDAFAGEDQELEFNVFETILNAELNDGASGGSWSILSGGGNIAEPNSAQTYVSDLRSGQNTFNWRVEKDNCFASDQVIVIVRDFQAYAGEDFTVCQSTTQMNARNENADLLEWSVISGSAVFEEPNHPKSIVSNLARGENVLRWSVTRNNYTSHDDVIVSNNDFDVSAGNHDETCDDIYTLNGEQPAAGGIGRWTIAGIGTGSFSNSSLYNTSVTNYSPGLNRYRWEITQNECTSSGIVEIVWNRSPIAAFEADFTEFHAPKTVNFFNNSSHYPEQSPADIFYWKIGDELFERTNSPHTPVSYHFADNLSGNISHSVYLIAYHQATGCSDTTERKIHVSYSATSINNSNAPKILLYPNPVQNILNIDFPYSSDYRLEIFDITGRLVYNKIFSASLRATANIQNLNAGMYRVIIYDNKDTYSGNIIVAD